MFTREICKKKLSEMVFCQGRGDDPPLAVTRPSAAVWSGGRRQRLSANLEKALSSKAAVCGLQLSYRQLRRSSEAGKSKYRGTVGRILG